MISISEWYHTGDDEWDDFVDENIDIFTSLLKVYGVLKFRELFHKAVGVSFAWTTIGFIAAKWGANVAGFYLSGLIDDRRGLANWNKFQQDVYDWGVVDEYISLGDLSIGDILPNPIALADKIADSVVMVSDFQWRRDQLATSVVRAHVGTFVDETYDTWRGLVSPQYDTTYGV